MANPKTNVMRFLDQKKIDYIPHEYEVAPETPLDGITVASLIKKDVTCVYKTLVTVGESKRNYVFVIPASSQLDFKKCAKAAGEKKIEMIKQKDLLPLTGYIHGGCSPLGMKKPFKTFFQEDVLNLETVTVSAGKIGRQIEIKPETIIGLSKAVTTDVIL